MRSFCSREHRVPRYLVKVLGCKVNQYEAQQIRQMLDWKGYMPASKGEGIDVVVLHTCAVTEEALRKSRQYLRRYRDVFLVLSGCAAANDLLGEEGADIASIPPGGDWLERLADMFPAQVEPHDEMPHLLRSFEGQQRAFLKIQDGCDICCSYCIVPYLRGAPRDKPLDQIISEAASLAASGYREIVITGVSIGLYGKRNGSSLAEVLSRLQEIDGIERIRVSSLHPGEMNDDLMAIWAQSQKIAPHVLLPLQSGSDRILQSMRRGYSRIEFLDAVRRVRTALDMPALNTDILVGFPGETDDDFRETVNLCRETGFARMHVFTYSPRPGTAAAGLPLLSPEILRRRGAVMRALGAETAAEYALALKGTTAEVLIEKIGKDGFGHGYTERYIPVVVRDAVRKGMIQRIRLLHWSGQHYECVGVDSETACVHMGE